MVQPILEVFTVPPFDENTYLIGDADTGDAIVVDPGGRVADVLRVAKDAGLEIRHVVNTHAHIDHVLGVDGIKSETGADFWLHADAEPMLANMEEQARRFGIAASASPTVDRYLEAGDTVTVGGLRFEVRYTPGHAPGHVTLVARDVPLEAGSHTFALVGDVIFFGGIGRTDLPGGDLATLMDSIETQILTLPDEAVLYSGHGPATTVGRERRHNPFIQQWFERGGRR